MSGGVEKGLGWLKGSQLKLCFCLAKKEKEKAPNTLKGFDWSRMSEVRPAASPGDADGPQQAPACPQPGGASADPGPSLLPREWEDPRADSPCPTLTLHRGHTCGVPLSPIPLKSGLRDHMSFTDACAPEKAPSPSQAAGSWRQALGSENAGLPAPLPSHTYRT